MGEDFDPSWVRVGPRVVTLVAAAQLQATRNAIRYVPDVLAETGQADDPAGAVSERAFVGVASDGRSLDGLLYGAVVEAKTASGNGLSPSTALAQGGRWLDMITQTMVADAARQAASVGITAQPKVAGYVRMLNPPSCSRCAVLAGKFFRWSVGFQRHPRCDCVNVPASEDMAGDLRTDPGAYFRSLSPAEQDRTFTQSGAQAIRDGADIGQVVNARRGALAAPGRLTTAERRELRQGRAGLERVDVFGRRVFVTTEGTSRRGIAGARLIETGGEVREAAGTVTRITRTGPEVRQSTRGRSRTPRLMPESIYEIAEDHEDAIRLLKRFGYLT